MDKSKQNLKGSESRDEFKLMHKKLHSSFYATDADLCLVSKYPPGTVAYLDYKRPGEKITFSEVIQYNAWLLQAPVYIIEGDPQAGMFIIKRYLGGDWKPEPPIVNLEYVTCVMNWQEFEKWEWSVRNEYQSKARQI